MNPSFYLSLTHANVQTEEFTSCRIDHYQTVDQVHVSVFAKQVDKERSSVKFQEQAVGFCSLLCVQEMISWSKLSIDLYLPGSKRFLKTIELFGPITPEQSAFQVFGTKVRKWTGVGRTRLWPHFVQVEVHLKKTDNRSWTILEKPTHDLGNIALTFGVSGRTGTIGAKKSVLDAQNSAREETEG